MVVCGREVWWTRRVALAGRIKFLDGRLQSR